MYVKLRSSTNFQVGDRVLILRPFYVTGKIGIICDVENSQPTRWIIKVDSRESDENIVVSLSAKEFQALSKDEKVD